jgi:hypothetical protein
MAQRRTTHRSSSGKKLYAVRKADGTFADIQTYKRAHSADMRRSAKAESTAKSTATTAKKAVKKAAKKVAAGAGGLFARAKKAIAGVAKAAKKSAKKTATKRPAKKTVRKAVKKAAKKS